MSNRKLIQQALDYDPIGDAMDYMGKDPGEDSDTMALAMSNMQEMQAVRKHLLQGEGDTFFCMPPDEFVAKIQHSGSSWRCMIASCTET